MMKKAFNIFAPALLVLSFSGSVLAVDIEAGPIAGSAEAARKCPQVCSGLEWNSEWRTVREGQASVCGTTVGVEIPVGLVGDHSDAYQKCPAQLARVAWNGYWATTVPNKMSVCGCSAPGPWRN